MKNKELQLLGSILITSFAASGHANADNENNLTSNVCKIENAVLAGNKCHEGDVLLYLPPGISTNLTLPYVVSALYCDYRYSITHSQQSQTTAVTCVFTKSRSDSWDEYGVAGY